MCFHLPEILVLFIVSFIPTGQNDSSNNLMENFAESMKQNPTFPEPYKSGLGSTQLYRPWPTYCAGTKWCGPGNNAKNYDDLGTLAATDKCCRDHDNCLEVIEPGQTKYGLTNNSSYTKLHCDCDLRFKSCLKDTHDLTSDMIGVGYFNLLNQYCFQEDDPATKCKEFYELSYAINKFSTRCKEYEKNATGHKAYTFRQLPSYP